MKNIKPFFLLALSLCAVSCGGSPTVSIIQSSSSSTSTSAPKIYTFSNTVFCCAITYGASTVSYVGKPMSGQYPEISDLSAWELLLLPDQTFMAGFTTTYTGNFTHDGTKYVSYGVPSTEEAKNFAAADATYNSDGSLTYTDVEKGFWDVYFPSAPTYVVNKDKTYQASSTLKDKTDVTLAVSQYYIECYVKKQVFTIDYQFVAMYIA